MLQQRSMSRGDSLSFLVPLVNPSTGAPLDLTGAKIWFTAKNNYVDPDIRAVIALDSDTVSGNGAVTILTPATSGQARIDINPIATRAQPDGVVKLVYDVQVKDAAGFVTTVENGTLTIIPDVTRSIA